MRKIVDILSPVGGKEGGVEEVIKSWTRNLDSDIFDLRIIHMTPGRAYLNGYPKAYSFGGPKESTDLRYYVTHYMEFMREHGAPDICVATNWPLMCVAANMARDEGGFDYKIFSWVHNRIESYHVAGLGGVAHMTYADAHLLLNSHNRNLIVANNPEAEVYVVGNPVDMEELENIEKTPFQLVYVGRLDEVKRVDIILEAIYRSKYPWKLKIIGDGPMREEWQQIVDYLKLGDRVEFKGWLNNPRNECKDAVAMIAASEYEGFMLTGVEALSIGVQVISTPVDGVVDYIKPGINGYLFGQENALELAQILDLIGDGSLPVCNPYECRKSVEKYETKAYFDTIKTIFMS